ncbi:ATP-binding protein [Streptomyces sp. NPDC086783]|uniref:ATP-binding protein n=1 Tax=Streptomyces sp. NPDC086783 TaxID=3365758 RepID=UPI0037F2D6F6
MDTNWERSFDLPLEHDLLAPAAARRNCRSVLQRWGLTEEQVYDALLVVSELVTNAVTHALPPVVLHLNATVDRPGQVRISVSDGGPSPVNDECSTRQPDDEHGRGAIIVSALGNSSGTTSDVDGLIDHWADLPAA